MINGLDLFSGIGGISFALQDWVKPLAYCENDRYAQAVLLSRMSKGEIALAPIWDDVRSLKSDCFDRRIKIDIISGGFPCQDISVAGNGVGLEGERSGLFFEIVRLVREIRPRFIFLENVPAITVRGLDRVLLELTALGYDSRWTIISAREVGACHQRDRWFLIAHDNSKRLWDRQQSEKHTASRESKYNGEKWDITDASSKRYEKQSKFREPNEEKKLTKSMRDSEDTGNTSNTNGARLERRGWKESKINRPSSFGRWNAQPTICRGDNGIPNRVDRIRGLGNAVVPLQAKTAFERLMGIA